MHLKTFTISLLSATCLVTGCVSPQSQQSLATLQAQCASGNKDACTAAGLQVQANQREANTNAAVAVGVGSALVGAAVVGAELSHNSGPGYGPYRRPYWEHPHPY
jgi:hypothetical protein